VPEPNQQLLVLERVLKDERLEIQAADIKEVTQWPVTLEEWALVPCSIEISEPLLTTKRKAFVIGKMETWCRWAVTHLINNTEKYPHMARLIQDFNSAHNISPGPSSTGSFSCQGPFLSL